MAHVVSASQRHLRVALIFGGALEAEQLLKNPKPVVLGYSDDAVLPLPAGVVEGDRLPIMRPNGPSYDIDLHPSIGGSVWLGRQRREVPELRGHGQVVRLGPDDFGVLTVGSTAVFYQMVKPAPSDLRWFGALLYGPASLASLYLATTLSL